MKKTLIIVFSAIAIFFIGLFTWLFYFQYARGEFILNSASSIDKGAITINEPFYLGFNVKWTGNGKPTINDIKLIKNDGSYLENDEVVTVEPFIEEFVPGLMNPTEALIEQEAVEQGLVEGYLPAQNYTINQQEFNVVLKVTLKDESYTNNINAIEIQYTNLNSQRENQFLYNGFFAQ
ncbi:hypothetical protein [Calidifontibacillus oryziterrae]|uniref:hypothetical protein n=1 Tax=Calidifontibacillus oryziterrae TaxID=1191699 RepID=UPI00030EB31C|nr:hypothetical protein [Calidifontibacillus oryziterrae]